MCGKWETTKQRVNTKLRHVRANCNRKCSETTYEVRVLLKSFQVWLELWAYEEQRASSSASVTWLVTTFCTWISFLKQPLNSSKITWWVTPLICYSMRNCIWLVSLSLSLSAWFRLPCALYLFRFTIACVLSSSFLHLFAFYDCLHSNVPSIVLIHTCNYRLRACITAGSAALYWLQGRMQHNAPFIFCNWHGHVVMQLACCLGM